MAWDNEDDNTICKVVVNHEEQYSIWPANRENPRGWRDAGKTGSKAECLEHVKAVWSDMRPLSLRQAMEKEAAIPPSDLPPAASEAEDAGDDLVSRLSTGSHAVSVPLRPERSAHAFKECLDRGFVLVKFTETRGGTELGFQVDTERSDLRRADIDAGTGSVHLEGRLTLDSVPVRCVADIELGEFTGTGRLERVDD